MIYLCNACDWGGLAEETSHPKHAPGFLLCPMCHETLEPFTMEEAVGMMHEHCTEFPGGD
jgi:hypothetical protein